MDNLFEVVESEDSLCIDNQAIKVILNNKVGSPIFTGVESGKKSFFNILKNKPNGSGGIKKVVQAGVIGES